MAKKKTYEEPDFFCEDCGSFDETACNCNDQEEEEPDVPTEEEDLNIEDDIQDVPTDDTEGMPDNPMGLAYQISKESDVVKQFVELPREVKFSFYDVNEKADVKHFARTYRDWQYIEKVLELRSTEDTNKFNNKEALLSINNKEALKQYFADTNRHYLINDIEDLSDDELDKFIGHIKLVKANEFMKSVESRKENIKQVYDKYTEDNDVPEYIDDAGTLGKIMDTSIASMGYKGNAAQHSVMTINAVKNEDIQQAATDKTRFSFLDAIKKRFG